MVLRVCMGFRLIGLFSDSLGVY